MFIVPRQNFTHDCSDWLETYGVAPPESAPHFHSGAVYNVPMEVGENFASAGWCEIDGCETEKPDTHRRILVANSRLGAKDSHG